MIISNKKPIEEIIEDLEGDKKIVILGCGECATATRTGGEPEVAEMKAALEAAGKEVVFTEVVHTGCHELDVKRILRRQQGDDRASRRLLGAVVRRGHAGVRGPPPTSTWCPGCDPLFLGNIQRSMDFLEKCSHCGACVIDDYGAICPITRCPKGLVNGPCGGTNHGKCEVDPEMDCAWVLIHEQLKKEGREDKRTTTHAPKEWNVIRHPAVLVERDRTDEHGHKLKMGSEK